MQDFATSIKHVSRDTDLNVNNIFRNCILCVWVHARVCVWMLIVVSYPYHQYQQTVTSHILSL